MNKLSIFVCLALSAIAASEFSELNISDYATTSDYAPYKTPGASSVRTEIATTPTATDETIRTMPGVFTQIDQAHGGVSINIRGMGGFGRVNTTVDGVAQTNYSTATDAAFHGDIGTSTFSTNVDSSFLASIDTTSGSFSHGSAGLMGSANLRTIDASDLIADGKNFGFLARYSYGTNAIGPSYMSAIAARAALRDDFYISMLYAYAAKSISQDYKIGGGKRVKDATVGADTDGDGVIDSFAAPGIDPKPLKNKPHSHMAKLELTSGIWDAKFSYRNYNNKLAGRKIDNNNYQLNFNADADNDLLNTNILLAYQDNKQTYLDEAMWGYHDMSGVHTKNKAISFDISNTSRFVLPKDHVLELTYGFNTLNNKYDNDFPQERVLLDYIRTSFYPKGEQNFARFYVDSRINKEFLQLDANFSYNITSLRGHKKSCSDMNPYCQPKEETDIKKSYKELDYSFMLSADVSPYFQPFASFTRTSRAPNVQEFFFTHDVNDTQNINTSLRPEIARTWQIGFNAFKEGVFNQSDVFALKALYYHSLVSDYINDRQYQFDDDEGTLFLLQYNDPKKAKFRGVELELSYDARVFYTHLAYSMQLQDHRYSDSESYETGGAFMGQKQFATQPKHVANLTVGTRLFDERLDLSANARYTGKSKRISPQDSLDDDPLDSNAVRVLKSDDELPKIPTIIDLHASYKPFKNLTITASVSNLFDKNYMDALYTYNSGEGQNVGSWSDPIFVYNNSARGRTFNIGFEYKY